MAGSLKVDKQLLNKIESLAAKGLNVAQIAAMLGVSRATLYRYKRQTEKIDTAIKRGRNKSIGLVISKLFENAMKGDNTAIIWFLKNKDPENWSENKKQESGSEHISEITFKVVK